MKQAHWKFTVDSYPSTKGVIELSTKAIKLLYKDGITWL